VGFKSFLLSTKNSKNYAVLVEVGCHCFEEMNIRLADEVACLANVTLYLELHLVLAAAVQQLYILFYTRFLYMIQIQGLSKRFERFKFGIFYVSIVKIRYNFTHK